MMAGRVTFLLAVCVLGGASVASGVEPAPEPPARAKPFFCRFYTPPALEVEAAIPSYTLPLKPTDIANWEAASKHFKSKRTAELLLKNGFAVEEGWGAQLGLIEDAYDNLPRDLPVVVTADTVLHVQHALYDQLFKQLEQVYLVRDLTTMTRRGLTHFDRAYQGLQKTAGVSTKKMAAVRRNVAYFAFALRLLQPEAVVPDYVERDVQVELSNVRAAAIAPSPTFIYKIDFSLFAPRGHYAADPALRRYFQAMTWYSLGALLFQGGPDMIVDAGTADIQTIQAVEIARFLADDTAALALWRRVHGVVEFFAGTMDDVSVTDVIRAKQELDAELAEAEPLGEAAYLARLREKLLMLPPPRIHAATGLPIRGPVTTPERKRQWLEQARAMRLFGPRFSLGGYAMSELTGFTYMGDGRPFTLMWASPVPKRGYPTPLDLMALLGSERAEELLRAAGDAEYAFYDRELDRLKAEFGALTTDEWHADVARARLGLIKMFLEAVPDGYPTVMRTAAWRERVLNTGLGAWAQLKHDMILVHKQPCLAFECMTGPSKDYAEPLPLLYAEVRAQNRALLRGVRWLFPELVRWDALVAWVAGAVFQRDPFQLGMYVSECRDAPPYVWPLVKFNRWLDDLMAVTLTELRFHPPDKAAEAFFGALGLDLAIIMSASQTHEKHPAVVADVFTEPNEGRVLEVATGRFNLLWMVYRLPDGRKVLGAGPVMSYYEFKRPMAARLTDEAWRGMIEEGTAPDPPAWTKHFLVRKPKDGD